MSQEIEYILQIYNPNNENIYDYPVELDIPILGGFNPEFTNVKFYDG